MYAFYVKNIEGTCPLSLMTTVVVTYAALYQPHRAGKSPVSISATLTMRISNIWNRIALF